MTGNQQLFQSPSQLNQQLDVDFALQAAGLGVWELNPVTKQIYWDDRCQKLFGLEKQHQIAYEQAIQLIHPDDVTRVDEAVQRAMSPHSEGGYDVTYRTIGANDAILRWVRFQGRSYFTPSGELYRFAGVAQDVTGSVQTQQDLAESQQIITDNRRQLMRLIEQSPVAIALFDGPQFVITLANEQVLQYWSRSREQVMNKPLFEALPEARGQGFEELLQGVYSTGKRFVAHSLSVTLERNGRLEPTYIDFVYEPFCETDHVISGVVVVCTEVTQQVLIHRQLEEQAQLLQQRERELNTLIENSPDVITRWDVDCRLLFCNGAFTQKAGQPLADLLGKTYQEMKQPPHITIPYMNALRMVLNSGQPDEFFNAFPTRRGDIYYYSKLVPEFSPDGSVQSVLGIARDVTQLKALEEQLEQRVQQRTQQLAVANQEAIETNLALQGAIADLTRSNDNLQQFAYVASHDLQEPLRKIQQFGNLLQQHYQVAGSTGEEKLYVDRMQSAAQRMSTLVHDLLSYARIASQRDTSGPVVLNDVLDAVLSDLEVSIAETGAIIEIDSLPSVTGNARQLGQLFQNLLSNALKFRRLETTPLVYIQSERIGVEALPPSVHPAQVASAYYRIDVRDNGIGFEEKHADRIFQVFQRLHGKSQYTGTGIGLAICEKVAVNHGGAITAGSQPGKGATFSVYLPARN